MTTEIWRPIKDYEGLYEISNTGKVKSLKKTRLNNTSIEEHIMKPSINHNGYLRVELSNNGKRKSYLIHRLVANAYIPNSNIKLQINHIDGNKQNNNLNNLEWCTPQDNVIHSWKYGLCKPHNTRRKYESN